MAEIVNRLFREQVAIGNTELVNETFYTYDVSTKNYKLEMVSKINQRTINNNDNINVEKLSSNQE